MPPKKQPPLDITQVLAKVRPREVTVTVCLAGDVAAEVDALEADLKTLAAGHEPSSLGDVDPRRAIALRILELQDEMRASEVPFRFRALPGKAWSDLLAAHPGKKKGDVIDGDTIQAPLLAACCIDPVMDVDQAGQLLDALNEGQRGVLFDAGWRVNTQAVDVPFSLLASAALHSTGER